MQRISYGTINSICLSLCSPSSPFDWSMPDILHAPDMCNCGAKSQTLSRGLLCITAFPKQPRSMQAFQHPPGPDASVTNVMISWPLSKLRNFSGAVPAVLLKANPSLNRAPKRVFGPMPQPCGPSLQAEVLVASTSPTAAAAADPDISSAVTGPVTSQLDNEHAAPGRVLNLAMAFLEARMSIAPVSEHNRG